MINPYETLGIAPGADEKQIKSAYKKLAKKHHPDVNGGDDQKFKEINEAYSLLTDKPKAGNTGGGPHVNMNDIFGEAQTIFDAIFRGGNNVLNRVRVDPELLIKGGTFDYTIQTLERVDNRIQPVFRTQQIVVEPDTPAMAQIAVPGGPKFNFIQLIPGDTARYQVTDLINLTEAYEINCFLAMTGGEIEVVSPSGRIIKIKIPAGTQPGSIHQVRGMGLRAPTGQRGDYNIRFSVKIPAIANDDDEILTQTILEKIKKR